MTYILLLEAMQGKKGKKMTDRTKVNIINPKVCCKNCLNDDPWDTCVQCSGHDLFLGLKEDKGTKSGYSVVKTRNCVVDVTPEELLRRIEDEKKFKGQAMFGGRLMDNIY